MQNIIAFSKLILRILFDESTEYFFPGYDLKGPNKKPSEANVESDKRIAERGGFILLVIEMPYPG